MVSTSAGDVRSNVANIGPKLSNLGQHWPKIGHIWRHSVELGPKGPNLPIVVNIGQISAKGGQNSAKFGGIRSKLASKGPDVPTLVSIGRTSAKVGQVSPNSANIGPTSANSVKLGQNWGVVKFDRLRANSGPNWSNSTPCCLISVAFPNEGLANSWFAGRWLPRSSQTESKPDSNWPNPDRSRPKLGQHRSISADIWHKSPSAKLDQFWPGVGPNRDQLRAILGRYPTSAKVSSNLGKHCPASTKIVVTSANFGQPWPGVSQTLTRVGPNLATPFEF